MIEITDTSYDSVFTARAEAGYIFGGWRNRPRGLFGGSLEPQVRINTIGFAGNDIIETILESDERFYLEPMFISLPDFADDVTAIDPDGPSNRPYFTNVWLAADMNNDSFDDLVIGGPRWENGSFVDVGVPLQVLLNDGNGFFKEDAALVFGSENAIPR
ncbi:MAG: hypothetical protein AAGF35_12890, partial [Pseudomonadota bacterium]